METKFHFGKTKSFWGWMVLMVVHNVNVLNATELDTEKMVKIVHFMLCIFYHQKKLKKKKFVKHFFLSRNLFLRVTCLYLEVLK